MSYQSPGYPKTGLERGVAGAEDSRLHLDDYTRQTDVRELIERAGTLSAVRYYKGINEGLSVPSARIAASQFRHEAARLIAFLLREPDRMYGAVRAEIDKAYREAL